MLSEGGNRWIKRAGNLEAIVHNISLEGVWGGLVSIYPQASPHSPLVCSAPSSLGLPSPSGFWLGLANGRPQQEIQRMVKSEVRVFLSTSLPSGSHAPQLLPGDPSIGLSLVLQHPPPLTLSDVGAITPTFSPHLKTVPSLYPVTELCLHLKSVPLIKYPQNAQFECTICFLPEPWLIESSIK